MSSPDPLFSHDGAGWHQAADLKVPDNMRPVRLPPYSPELNPVDHLWDEIREKWFPDRSQQVRDVPLIHGEFLAISPFLLTCAYCVCIISP
jgi:transposase